MVKMVDNEKITKLLLSGAKMTDKHCKKCSYPLFEKDGKIFCINCPTKTKEDIINEKLEFLYRELKNSQDVEEIEKIGKTILILKKIKSS